MEFFASLSDYILHVDTHLLTVIREYGVWVYALLFCIVFCETGLVVTPFLPGDSLLFACGVAAGSGFLGYQEVLILLFCAGVSGDACNYLLGRLAGPILFTREHRLIKKVYLLRAHAFYQAHGGKAILLARFIPILRTFAPFVAGIALMQPRAFLLYNCTGCALWVGGLVSLGYFLGNLPWVKSNFSLIAALIVVFSLIPLLLSLWRSPRSKP